MDKRWGGPIFTWESIFNEKQYGGKKIPKVWSNTQFQSGSPQSCSMDSSVVLYGQPSNFLIDRQRDDPTKDKSQSNLGIPSQVEYCPSFILTIIDNGVLNITKLWWQRGFKCWLWNWPCRSKRMEVIILGLMTSVLAVIHHLFISISAKLPRQSQLSLVCHFWLKLFPPSLPQHFRFLQTNVFLIQFPKAWRCFSHHEISFSKISIVKAPQNLYCLRGIWVCRILSQTASCSFGN